MSEISENEHILPDRPKNTRTRPKRQVRRSITPMDEPVSDQPKSTRPKRTVRQIVIPTESSGSEVDLNESDDGDYKEPVQSKAWSKGTKSRPKATVPKVKEKTKRMRDDSDSYDDETQTEYDEDSDEDSDHPNDGTSSEGSSSEEDLRQNYSSTRSRPNAKRLRTPWRNSGKFYELSKEDQKELTFDQLNDYHVALDVEKKRLRSIAAKLAYKKRWEKKNPGQVFRPKILEVKVKEVQYWGGFPKFWYNDNFLT